MGKSFVRYRFEDLDVWKEGMAIAKEVYKIIRKFPAEEKFGLIDQLRRAAVSIVLNIAEGSGQPTRKGFAVYVQRSKSSLLECVACLRIAIQENYIKEEDLENLQNMFKQEYFKLVALGKAINK